MGVINCTSDGLGKEGTQVELPLLVSGALAGTEAGVNFECLLGGTQNGATSKIWGFCLNRRLTGNAKKMLVN